MLYSQQNQTFQNEGHLNLIFLTKTSSANAKMNGIAGKTTLKVDLERSCKCNRILLCKSHSGIGTNFHLEQNPDSLLQ